MDFDLTDEQAMARSLVRDLAAEEIAPLAARIDAESWFPGEVIRMLGRVGLFGILLPPAYGGTGGDRIDLTIAIEEIAVASASVAWSALTSTGVAFAILAFGDEDQRSRYLPALASGSMLGSFALVEPGGGTNWPLTLRTRAVPDGDDYVIEGAKCFISNAGEAEIYAVMTRTDPEAGPAGFSILLVEKGTPGFSFGRMEDKFGLRGDPTGELVFEECRVPARNLLGGQGGGVGIFQAFGALDCVGHGAVCVGLARAALEASRRYVGERTVIGEMSLAGFENVQRAIADMAVEVEAARLITRRAALVNEGGGLDPWAFSAAMFGNRVALDVTGKAVELHGGYGCTSDFEVGRYFRDAKTLSLQKTSEFVRSQIGKMILGVPMGPPPGSKPPG